MKVGAGVELRAAHAERYADILTTEALAFAVNLERRFGARRRELFTARNARQVRLDHGERPNFLPVTRQVREVAWKVAALPAELLDRRVQITGPVDRRNVVQAMNSGAKVFVADFEDATTPTWANLIEGQINLRDANRRSITADESANGNNDALGTQPAVVFVRVRGWHMEEAHLLVDGEPMSASLFDFALYAFHNARELWARGSGAYFNLPKLESHLEARLWNQIFVAAETELGVPAGAIKATVLVETILAAFEMDEILYELRDHSAGLGCCRADYIFSYIKKLAGDKAVLLPDRSQMTGTTHFLRSCALLAVQTCHRRGAQAVGEISALPSAEEASEAYEAALTQMRIDVEREATDGFDGTSVTSPEAVAAVTAVFDRVVQAPLQVEKRLKGLVVTAEDLLRVPDGTITEEGLGENVAIALGYVEAWLRGAGRVLLAHRRVDAATAECSRALLWQWVHHGARLADGRAVTIVLCDAAIDAELARATAAGQEMGGFTHAAFLLRELIRAPRFTEFLTLPAYARVVAAELTQATEALHQD